MDAHEFRDVDRVKTTAKQLGLESVPAVFPLGHGEWPLRHDPDLAEARPRRGLVLPPTGDLGCADTIHHPWTHRTLGTEEHTYEAGPGRQMAATASRKAGAKTDGHAWFAVPCHRLVKQPIQTGSRSIADPRTTHPGAHDFNPAHRPRRRIRRRAAEVLRRS